MVHAQNLPAPASSFFQRLVDFRFFAILKSLMSVLSELAALWFTTISQLTGSKHYRLRSRGMTYTQARTRELRNKINPRLRWKVLKRDYFTCTKCGRKPPYVRLEVDHIYPLAQGGTNNEKNLATLCNFCNSGKGASI